MYKRSCEPESETSVRKMEPEGSEESSHTHTDSFTAGILLECLFSQTLEQRWITGEIPKSEAKKPETQHISIAPWGWAVVISGRTSAEVHLK